MNEINDMRQWEGFKVLEDIGFVPALNRVDELDLCQFITEELPADPFLAVSVRYNENLFSREVQRHRANGRRPLGYLHGKWLEEHAEQIPAEWREFTPVFPATVVKDARDFKGDGRYNHRYFPYLIFCKDGIWRLKWRGVGCDRIWESDQLPFLAW